MTTVVRTIKWYYGVGNFIFILLVSNNKVKGFIRFLVSGNSRLEQDFSKQNLDEMKH